MAGGRREDQNHANGQTDCVRLKGSKMRWAGITLMLAAVVVSGCEKQNNVQTVSSLYKNGETQTQPVIYNGKPYTVGFTYRSAQNLYDVTVAGKGGRPLGGKDGDRKIVEQIGSSTVRHYACRDSQKGRILPGSAKHAGKKWQMQARCG